MSSLTIYAVYILKCSDDSYYVGVTNDMVRRLGEHQNGNNPTSYTYRRRPVELVLCLQFQDIIRAKEKEQQLKGWSRRKKEALIAENWEDLVKFSKKSFK